jgi:hypothetical protein
LNAQSKCDVFMYIDFMITYFLDHSFEIIFYVMRICELSLNGQIKRLVCPYFVWGELDKLVGMDKVNVN